MSAGRALALAASLAVALGAAAFVHAADGPEGRVTARSYEIRYKPLPDAAALVSEVLSPRGTVSFRPQLRRLVVQDVPEVLDRVQDLLDGYDVPPRNVEVTVSLFLGSDVRDDEAGRHAPASSITREVRGIRETLADFTRWAAFDPLGSRSVSCVEGATVTTGLSDDYQVVFVVDAVRTQQGRERIEFGRFTLQRRIRTADGGERIEDLLSSKIILPAGQQLLVGAAKRPESKRALFVLLRAEPR